MQKYGKYSVIVIETMSRNRAIIRTSAAGIAGNLLLAVFKLAVGTAANSVSIITDAVNNIADGMSSLVTIIGTRLSEKEPDKEHPFGYGRIEYLSSLIIGLLITYAGFDALRSSVLRLLHPEPVDYSALTMAVVAAGVLVKVLIGLHTKKQGEKLSSQPLIASGIDALNDSIGSAAILLAAVIYMMSGYAVEAWVGAAISLLIMKNGIVTLRETASGILGEAPDIKLAAAVRNSIQSFPEIDGVYDLAIHSYGRERLVGSAHIEVSDQLTVAWIDNLQRAVIRKVKEDTGVEMMGLSIYAINTSSGEIIAIREAVRNIVRKTEGGKEMHGFYIDFVDKTMNFEAVLEFGVRSAESFRKELLEKVKTAYPEYDIQINVLHDFTE